MRSPSDATPSSATRRLFDTLPGRLFLLSSALLLVILGVQYFVELPLFVVVFRRVVSIALILSGIWLAVQVVRRQWGQFLWRVRRKLILSYLFVGLVPVVLVGVFVAAATFVLYTNIVAFMFHEGLNNLEDDIHQIAQTSAYEIERSPATAQSGLDRKYANLTVRYPTLSLAVVRSEPPPSPASARADTAPVASAGPWAHQSLPGPAPTWVSVSGGFTGIVLQATDGPVAGRLVIRSAVPAGNGLTVIADLPVDVDIIDRLQARTATRIGDAALANTGDLTVSSGSAHLSTLFRQSVTFISGVDWRTGVSSNIAVQLDAPVRQLFDRIGQQASLGSVTGVRFDDFLGVLKVAGALLLIVQGSALFFGVLLGRQITSAVHELFVGTERIRAGDFSHRVKIESGDQLEALATSFNDMSASMLHFMHVQREKQRLDEELRIARDIQKSLLPVELPKIAGLGIADLCEPAREVGGDYYDLFVLGPQLIGVLVADVSGKGTSAALYMAELKGLMLALSQAERSPRQLLIDLNRRLAGQLDNRSFITMAYAVLDLDAMTLTCARAGHTPLILISGSEKNTISPEGMVLGLRLPGASERFEKILAEETRPLSPGDIVVLYTDGITEAMDQAGELFGEAALTRVVSSHRHLDAAGIRERVLREVRSFVGEAEQHDDMTMVVLKVGEPAGA